MKIYLKKATVAALMDDRHFVLSPLNTVQADVPIKFRDPVINGQTGEANAVKFLWKAEGYGKGCLSSAD